jgi:hypothetical protein
MIVENPLKKKVADKFIEGLCASPRENLRYAKVLKAPKVTRTSIFAVTGSESDRR